MLIISQVWRVEMDFKLCNTLVRQVMGKVNNFRFIKIIAIVIYTLISQVSLASEDTLPLIQVYVNNSVNDFSYFYSAKKSCEVEVIKKNREINENQLNINPCMESREIYRIDEVKVENCEWSNETPESPIKFIGDEVNKIKKKLHLKNIKIIIQDSTIICRADLIIPKINEKIELEAPCAPPLGGLSGHELSIYKPKPVLAFFKAVNKVNPLSKSIEKYLMESENRSEFTISFAIPLPHNISHYIQYLLSNKAENDCKNKEKLNSKSPQKKT